MLVAENLIPILFSILFFFVPLVLFPKTSEIFEFNKMVLTYSFTVLIIASWLIKTILQKKIIFRRTFLDPFLAIFLLFQFLSFLVSIDPRTSLLGYYSRFHGGLLSTVSYLLLYWAYVSNMDGKKALKTIYFLLASATLVSIYGVLEHLGIDKNIWVQDVQNRVFSTLGQPNWLAAWLIALTPLTWSFALNEQLTLRNKKFWLWTGLSALFFLTLLYTKSRSGLLGFSVAYVTFWGGTLWIRRKNIKTLRGPLLVITSSLLLITFLVGTPWTPTLSKLLSHQPPASLPAEALVMAGPALETGGTESGEIRKIVWKGAIDIWKHYPVLGTGVETFAFSYYRFRPVEHNLVSEWDYLYNKAHNEYLNFAATTGTVGLITYLILIAAMSFIFLKKIEHSLKIENCKLIITALMAGFTSILVTNFFGFSVVPVALQFFLFPAFATSLSTTENEQKIRNAERLTTLQKIGVLSTLLLTTYYLLLTSRYWYSDFLYAKGKVENDSGNFVNARKVLTYAVKLSPHEAIFWDELSQADTGIAVAIQEEGNSGAENFAELAISESGKAVNLSPANVNLKRTQASIFVKLSSFNPDYLIKTKETLEDTISLAPTDAKLFYNLALAYVRVGERERAIETLIKTAKMKPNYREARYALALLYIDDGQAPAAKEQLEYILTKINPQDAAAQKELDELIPNIP